jgi:hypothetical protein
VGKTIVTVYIIFSDIIKKHLLRCFFTTFFAVKRRLEELLLLGWRREKSQKTAWLRKGDGIDVGGVFF